MHRHDFKLPTKALLNMLGCVVCKEKSLFTCTITAYHKKGKINNNIQNFMWNCKTSQIVQKL